jgi:hypothetical protein
MQEEWKPAVGRNARLRRDKKTVLITDARYVANNSIIYTAKRANMTFEVYYSDLLPPEAPETTAS